jgi:predicted transcriptional regulator
LVCPIVPFISRFHSSFILFQPVCNEDGNAVGLLDITKVFREAIGKVERSPTASAKLYNAVAGVQSELGGITSNPQATAMPAYVEASHEKIALPDLTTVMGLRTQPATGGPKATIREVANLMQERRVTTVCVTKDALTGAATNIPRIAGIFSSKDMVLRVIAAGLDAGRCSVARVMIPRPDTVSPSTTIRDALKKMHSECPDSTAIL